MGFRCGIVGLPNVGKSTLFNALSGTAAAESANYPFCTIEPNVGRVGVPDRRLDRLGEMNESAKIVPTHLEFVDIAGLVAGASQGEGLGNTFLAHIREVDAICHVLRCFEDDGITHVAGAIDPISDAATVETELMLADLESLEKRMEGMVKRARGGDAAAKESKAALALAERAAAALREGQPARTVSVTEDEQNQWRQLQLLTTKPVLYVCNVDEDSAVTGNPYTELVARKAAAEGAEYVVISAAIESEIAQLGDLEERQEFLDSLGLEATGLDRLIHAGYRLLGLITYFTAGPKESRAWTIPDGMAGAQAAGVIHTDFERGFICAETIPYDTYVDLGGEQAAKDAGMMRQEGRDYLVKDGDVLLFRFNV